MISGLPVFTIVFGWCLVLSSCSEPSPEFHASPGSPLGIVTFAGNINILHTFGDGSVERAPQETQAITRLLLLYTARRLDESGVTIRGVSRATLQSGLDASQLMDLDQEDLGWVRHVRGRAMYVGVGSGMAVLQPSDSIEIARIASVDRVPAALWAISSYEWSTGGWRSELPFGRTNWRFKIRTALKILDQEGRERWRGQVSAESGPETGSGRNYVLYSSTAITDAQAKDLVESAVENASKGIAQRITTLYEGGK
ncbi:MAG TPA: hypothetical protein VF647_12990 [Longimicrobium sp.]|jgi:hypothetical protein